VVAAYAHDPFVLNRITARLWREVELAQRRVRERASEVTLPTLVLVGADDYLVDTRAILATFERLGSRDKRLVSYPGYFHEVLNEVGWERVLRDVLQSLDSALMT